MLERKVKLLLTQGMRYLLRGLVWCECKILEIPLFYEYCQCTPRIVYGSHVCLFSNLLLFSSEILFEILIVNCHVDTEWLLCVFFFRNKWTNFFERAVLHIWREVFCFSHSKSIFNSFQNWAGLQRYVSSVAWRWYLELPSSVRWDVCMQSNCLGYERLELTLARHSVFGSKLLGCNNTVLLVHVKSVEQILTYKYLENVEMSTSREFGK